MGIVTGKSLELSSSYYEKRRINIVSTRDSMEGKGG